MSGMKGPRHGNGYGDALALPLVVVLKWSFLANNILKFAQDFLQ